MLALFDPELRSDAGDAPIDAKCDWSAIKTCGETPSVGIGGNKLDTGALLGNTFLAIRDRRAGFCARARRGSASPFKNCDGSLVMPVVADECPCEFLKNASRAAAAWRRPPSDVAVGSCWAVIPAR